MNTTFTNVFNINLQAPAKYECPFFHSPKWDNPYFVAWWLYNDKGFGLQSPSGASVTASLAPVPWTTDYAVIFH